MHATLICITGQHISRGCRMESSETKVEQQMWHSMSVSDTATVLKTDHDSGLSSQEAAKRFEVYGPNELTEAPPHSIWSMFVSQLQETLVLMLIAAATISGALGEWKDAVVILLIVLLNAALGVLHEHRAESAMRALKELSQPLAKVLRDGATTRIPSSELVPGDVVVLEAGDFIPADLRLTETAALRIDESALTGESVPVEKSTQAALPSALNGNPPASIPLGEQRNLAFMSTVVTYGRGHGIVIRSGMQTEIGRVAQLIQEAPQETTPLQKRLDQLGKTLGLVAIALVIVVFAAGILRGESALEMLMTSISLAVAAVPEGLAAIVTIVLALGMQQMSRQRAIIRRLPAVETLGAATVICSDKTGTLTRNEMTVVAGYVDNQHLRLSDDHFPNAPSGTAALLAGASLANDAHLETTDSEQTRIIGDPTEGALLIAAMRMDLDLDRLTTASPRLDEVPFDSRRKMMTTLHHWQDDGLLPMSDGYVTFTKGAPDVLIGRCDAILHNGKVTALSDETRQQLLDVNASFAQEGLRVLAVAFRAWSSLPEQMDSLSVERNLTFIGLVAMQDPPREEVKEAVRQCFTAGARPVMITGDHKDTAVAIAREVGIWHPQDQVLTGSELEAMSDDQLQNVAERVTVYARVSPEHKLRIVNAYKRHGHVVAMTGDGVNDAPALKRADIGVAMGITGTDVAKEAADMVLTDDNFATIIAAMATGRTVFANIQKVIHYLLSCNAGEIAAIFFAIVFGWGRPLTAIQILWMNLVTDGAPALALGVEPGEKDVMNQRPRRDNEGVLANGLGWTILWQGVLLGGLTMFAFWYTLQRGAPIEEARTLAFLTLSLSQMAHALNARSRTKSVFKLGLFSNRPLVGALALSVTLQLAVVLLPPLQPIFNTVPLTNNEWDLVLMLSLSPLVIGEVIKAIRQRFRKAQ
jgi:Ca2+-transporting ATPase